MHCNPTIKDLIDAFNEVLDISRPSWGDNDGEPLNSPCVYDYLSEEDQQKVDTAEDLAYRYTRLGKEEVDQRRITILNKNGYPTCLGADQYDPYRLVGTVTIGEWQIDISD